MAGELLDLVCGPASPLPETYQRYRLVAHLGSGGQAEVYRAVRLCGGVSSAPMTVKVFRVDPRRPIADELRSWDKGDAALMDLNNRGVNGICRRADGFYGPPPHRPGEPPQPGNAVPYQIYDYLHGVNLRSYLRSAGEGAPGPRLNAVTALRTLAVVLRALHEPADVGACPVLHMDVKPSNVMVLTSGEVRLIDFTGARYWRVEEITQIAYTPESGGPEALSGRVGPAYDVHGFGSVAYFMVTGDMPRGQDVPPPASHPLLSGRPALRDALLAPLAERPEDRPSTLELSGWVETLAGLVRAAKLPELGVDWAEPERPVANTRAVGRASVVSGTETEAYRRIERLERELVELRAAVGSGGAGGTAVGGGLAGGGLAGGGLAGGGLAGGAAVAANGAGGSVAGGKRNGSGGAGPGGMKQGGAAVGAGAVAAGFGASMATGGGQLLPTAAYAGRPLPGTPAPGGSSAGASAPGGTGQGGSGPGGTPAATVLGGSAPGGTRPMGAGGPGAGANGGPGAAAMMRGRAPVVPKPPQAPDTSTYPDAVPQPRRERAPMRDQVRVLKRGIGWTWTGVTIAFLGWGVWAIANRGHHTILPALTFGVILLVAGGLFALQRLVGRLVFERWLGRPRRTATLSHLGTAAFLTAVGLAYLRQTPWVISLMSWVQGH